MEPGYPSSQDPLYDSFEGDHPLIPDIVRLPGETIVEQVHAEHPEIEERNYQIDCLAALNQVRHNGKHRALIHMATGLGKTTVAALDVKDFMQHSSNGRVLFVAHQNDILRQAQARFELIIGDQYSYGPFSGDSKAGKDADCVFASFQQLHRSREEFESDAFDYIVVDESHHSKATTYEPSLQYFSPQFLLGMTATPDRRDLKEIRDIFGSEIYAKTLDEALSERLLASPDYRVILDDVAESLLNPGEADETTLRDLNRTVFVPKRDEEIVRIIHDKISTVRQPKTIIFCPSIEYADRMADLVDGAQSLHSQKTVGRRDLLDQFVEGSVRTLTAVDMLNEGVDIADANVIVFLRSTQSETIFLQQLGRGLRRVPGKDSVLVLDFVASCDRLMMVDNLLSRYVKDTEFEDSDDPSEPNDEIYDLNFDDIEEQLNDELDIARLTFNESARRIIDIIRAINRRSPPEGHESLRDLARELSVNKKSLLLRLGHLGISVSLATNEFDTLKNSYISHEDAQRLREYSAGAPDDYLSMTEAAAVLDIEPLTVMRQAERLGLELKYYPGGNKKPRAYITREDVQRILEEREATDHLVPLQVACEILGMSEQTILKRALVLDIEISWDTVRTKGGRPSQLLTKEGIQKIKDYSEVPDGWISYKDAAHEIGIGINTLSAKVKALGLEQPMFLIHGKPSAHLSHKDVQEIKKLYEGPEGWVNVRELSTELGKSISAIRFRLGRLGINLAQVRNPSTKIGAFSSYISPAEAEKVRASYQLNKGEGE